MLEAREVRCFESSFSKEKMKENTQGEISTIEQRFSPIESLIDRKEFKQALAEIRDLESQKQTEPFSVEDGLLCYLLSASLQGLGRYKEALCESQKAFEILRNTPENKVVAQIHFLRGIVFSDLGDLKRSEVEFRDAVADYKRDGDKKGIAHAFNELARICFIKAEYKKATEHLTECISYCDEIEDKQTKAKASANLGRIHIRVGNWKLAEAYLKVSTKTHEEDGNKLGFCNGLLSLGYVCFKRRDFRKAKECYEHAFKLIYKNNYTREMAIYYEYYGELAFTQGNYLLAEDHYRNGIKIGEDIAGAGDIVSQTYRLLGELQIAERQYDKALASCEKALKVATSLGERIEIGAIHRTLGQIYTTKKQKEKATESFKKSIHILEEIGAKFELGKAYLEAGKSDCFDFFDRVHYLRRAKDVFEKLDSQYYQGLVSLAIGELFLEHDASPRSLDYLDAAETIFTELSERKELNLVSDLKKKAHSASEEPLFPEKGFLPGIITQDPQTLYVINKAKQIMDLSSDCDSAACILVEGETGTGKDELVKTILSRSGYKDKPFIEVNCSSITNGLEESELFGHERGAFTGANKDKKGLIEAADGGILFFNEIGDLPLHVQPKLLAVLEHKPITRVGDTKPIHVNVRVIAATNKDLEKEVEAGNFRQDLYERLRRNKIVLPPLRERKGDIPLLVPHFLKKLLPGKLKGYLKDYLGMHPMISEAFENYHWPRNVRELENEIWNLIVDSNGNAAKIPALLQEFLKRVGNMKRAGSFKERVDEFQRELIMETLTACNWVKAEAARELGIPLSSLAYIIKRLNIQPST